MLPCFVDDCLRPAMPGSTLILFFSLKGETNRGSESLLSLIPGTDVVVFLRKMPSKIPKNIVASLAEFLKESRKVRKNGKKILKSYP